MSGRAVLQYGKRRLRAPAARVLLAAARRRPAMAGAALCYHSVGDPQGRAGYELVPRLGSRLFADQLRLVRDRFTLVTASELPEAVAARRRGAPFPLAVTFDDDLAGHAAVTLDLLRAERIPATFFVGGASLDGPRPFFWEALQAALDAGMPADDPLLPRVHAAAGPGGVHRLADAIRRLPRAERDTLTVTLTERAGGTLREAGLAEPALRRLVDAGFEIGFHTRDHESLDLLGDDELAAALRDGRRRLEEIAGRPLSTFAYPFGLADARVADAARAAGFQTGYTLAPVPVHAHDDPLRLGRFQPSFASADRTGLELARALAGTGRS
jgi:peptidoglycan/xylan/chitin deacetylase (PgdA/CDA1 family)